ncbi:hypothetical protein KIN20_031796 [Parelaphostrongylus tenuis]|uniref:Uncharacterized protein n=1 Tax=Parelaphostrongylus tenuis TaxID=148309 RepID=A0AAD5R5Z1_PARTN|nr:hypothetical protein KIN20_031796 [Parelaphostrongylus tenuis]
MLLNVRQLDSSWKSDIARLELATLLGLKMDTLRRFGLLVYEFWRSTIEWRSPASAPYLMIVNMGFWSAALYCSELVQIRLLLTLAAGIIGWDVLLSPTHERNIATHVALWPLQSIWRTLSVCGCLYSSHQLRLQHLETACITAYGTVGCLLVNPVWDYYEVNQKIVSGAKICVHKTADVTKLVIIHPLQRVWQAVKYVLLLQFIPPLWYGFISFLVRIRSSIKDGAIYVVSYIKNSVFMTINYFESLVIRVKVWISETLIEPTKRRYYAFGRWLRYWFCAHWWPDLKLWIRNRIGQPLRRAFNYFCFGLVYLLCGHWIPPVWVWLRAWLGYFKDFMMAQARRLRDFIHRTVVVPTKNYFWRKFNELRAWLRQCLHWVALTIRDSVLWPICVLVVDIGRELSMMIYRLLIQPILYYSINDTKSSKPRC